MLKAEDIKKLVKDFVTKNDLANVKVDIFSIRQEIKKIREEMMTRDDFRKVMGLVESVFTEVKKTREEQSFHIGIHERVDEEIDSLKKQVIRLETPTL